MSFRPIFAPLGSNVPEGIFMYDPAVTIEFEHYSRPNLYLVPEISEPRFISADSIIELAVARENERIEAHEMLQTNRNLLMDGHFDDVLPVIDALGSAKLVVDSRNEYGHESSEANDLFSGLVLDCQRLFAEAERKKTWEYFPPVRQDFDPQTQEFFANGRSLTKLINNSMSPISNPEEQNRRINEKIEEGTYRWLGSMVLKNTSETIDIPNTDNEIIYSIKVSQCIDSAIESYEINPKGSHGGYVPEIKKIMIRGVKFVENENARYQEQVGISGIYITNEIINQAYQIMGVTEQGSNYDKNEIHNMHVIAQEDFDIFEFIELLDLLASETTGKNIFMGEEVSENTVKDYTDLPRQAIERQKSQLDKSTKLAEKLVEWEEAGIDHWVAERMVEDYVDKELHKIAVIDIEKAAIIFDEETAEGYRRVQQLKQDGQLDLALQLQARVEENAPAPQYCTGGSCGLESVDIKTEVGKKIAEKLELKSNEKIAKDVERKCKCGNKSIYYAWTSNTVKKYCDSCGAYEKKITTGKGTK